MGVSGRSTGIKESFNGTAGKPLFIAPSPQHLLNLQHNLCNALLFFQNILDKLLRWQVFKVFFAAWVFDVQVAVVGEKLLDRDFPGAFVLFALIPPRDASVKLFI